MGHIYSFIFSLNSKCWHTRVVDVPNSLEAGTAGHRELKKWQTTFTILSKPLLPCPALHFQRTIIAWSYSPAESNPSFQSHVTLPYTVIKLFMFQKQMVSTRLLLYSHAAFWGVMSFLVEKFTKIQLLPFSVWAQRKGLYTQVHTLHWHTIRVPFHWLLLTLVPLCSDHKSLGTRSRAPHSWL